MSQTPTPQIIDATNGTDHAQGWLFLPEGEAPCPLVVFYADAAGLRPAMSEMAAHLTQAGYAVLLPDIYLRQQPLAPFDCETVFSDPPERARLMALLGTIRPAQVLADTQVLLDHLAAHIPRIQSEKAGFVGYCVGGRLAFLAAAGIPERVAATAAIHAGGLVTDAPDSPHRQVARIAAPLYLGVADSDTSCTPQHQQQLREVLDAAGVTYQLEMYPGARHGFAVPDFPAYSPSAAGPHWQRVLALFGAATAPR